jgi:putative membrane protein
MKLILRLLITMLGVWIAFSIVPGLDYEELWKLAVVALLVALVNAVVKPIMNLFSLPLVILTLGLFLLVTNALALQLVIWLSAPERLDLGITSTGFFWATFLGALVISIVRFVADKVTGAD